MRVSDFFQLVCQAVTAALMACWLNFVTETHRTMAVVDEPDLPWKKLKCFACCLHGLLLPCTSVFTFTPYRQVTQCGQVRACRVLCSLQRKMPSHYYKPQHIQRISCDVALGLQPCVNQVLFCLSL